MGLFDRKKTTYENSTPLYTIGNSNTLLIVGLGNPGEKYASNRHNLGFMVVDKYRQSHEFSEWVNKKDLNCQFSSGQIGSTRVILVKPTTFMNNSGEAVLAMQNFYKVRNSDTLVVHDELDISFGSLRTRTGGSSAGHNGIKSLTDNIGEDYGRIRIGIGPKDPPQIDSADFVLQNFSSEEQDKIPKVLREVCALLDERTVGPLTEMTLSV